MNLSKLAIVILAAGLVAFMGCGKADPTKPEEPKPGDKKDSTPTPGGSKENPGGVTPLPPAPLGPTLLAPTDPVQTMVEKFIADLGNTTDMPELLKRCSPAFLKIIGKPMLTDADTKLGYSVDQASSWLRRAGMQLTGIGLPTGYGSPSMAVFVGSFGNRTGRILVRMVYTDAWKIDYFSLGTIAAPVQSPTNTEGSYQDFTVLAFLDAITSKASSKDDRVALFGAVLSTKLKQSWAEPFDGDKTRGFDFNATKLGMKLDEFGAGVTGFTRAPDAGDSFKIELLRGDAKTTYLLKLVKGAIPGEWLVDEFNKQ